MLSESERKRRIRHHVQNLGSANERVSIRAERYLDRYYGAQALEELIAACLDPNPVVRFRAVWLLGKTHDVRAYETILRLTDDPDARVRYDATVALGVHGDPRAVEPLLRMWLEEDDTGRAPMAIAKLGPSALPAVEEALRSENPNVRHAAVSVLGGLALDYGNTRAIQLLKEGLADPSPYIREDVQDYLEEIGKLDF